MNDIPLSLRGIKGFLSQLASPALPTTSTTTLLHGNASNWLQMNLQILEEHYVDMIAGIRTNLLRPVNIDHQKAWLVALRWAVRKYRIDEEVVFTVMKELIAVGLRIDQIPKGSTLKAIRDVPSKRPRPKTHQKSKSATPRAPAPSTSTGSDLQADPDNQPLTYTSVAPIDQPPTTTPMDQGLNSTNQNPPPNPRPAISKEPLIIPIAWSPPKNTTGKPPLTTNSGPSTDTLPSPPQPTGGTISNRTNKPPTLVTRKPPTTTTHPQLVMTITPIPPPPNMDAEQLILKYRPPHMEDDITETNHTIARPPYVLPKLGIRAPTRRTQPSTDSLTRAVMTSTQRDRS